MDEGAAREHSWRETVVRQGQIAMVGLLVVVVPFMVVGNAFDHLHKVVHKALIAVEPRVEALGGGTIALFVVIALLLCAWVIGRLMTHTELGQRILAWEKSVFAKRSPVVEKRAEREAAAEEAAARAASPARPGLANLQGGWQPCVIFGTAEGPFSNVFVPRLPAIETGSLYVLKADQVRPLDVPLEEFRATLKKYGHGGTQWAAALAADEPTRPGR